MSADAESSSAAASASAHLLSGTGLRARWVAAYAGWTERISRWFERAPDHDSGVDARASTPAVHAPAEGTGAADPVADLPGVQVVSAPTSDAAASRHDEGTRA